MKEMERKPQGSRKCNRRLKKQEKEGGTDEQGPTCPHRGLESGARHYSYVGQETRFHNLALFKIYIFTEIQDGRAVNNNNISKKRKATSLM